MIQIPLRRKYRHGFHSKFKGGENPAKKKHRNKIGYLKHVALHGEPRLAVLIVDGHTGKSVMR